MTEQTGISFITTFTRLKPGRDGRVRRISRCVGYLADKQRAIDAVKKNAGDIYEVGTYPLCVVETLGEGIYPNTISTHWFEWVDGVGYREIPNRPKDLERVVGFSLG